MYPQIFVGATLGAGINEIIKKNIEAPSLIDLFIFTRNLCSNNCFYYFNYNWDNY